jgi:GAF domain-containing protein
VPAIVDDRVRLVLDIDSDKLDDFSDIDAIYIKQIIRIIEGLIKQSIQ